MTPDPQDTIGQVRVELAELRGMMTTVVADHGRRITDLDAGQRQLRTDLTAVNENLNATISRLLSEGNKKASEIQTAVTTNTANIADMRNDVTALETKQSGFGSRVATYVSPFLATAALFFTFYEFIKR